MRSASTSASSARRVGSARASPACATRSSSCHTGRTKDADSDADLAVLPLPWRWRLLSTLSSWAPGDRIASVEVDFGDGQTRSLAGATTALAVRTSTRADAGRHASMQRLAALVPPPRLVIRFHGHCRRMRRCGALVVKHCPEKGGATMAKSSLLKS